MCFFGRTTSSNWPLHSYFFNAHIFTVWYLDLFLPRPKFDSMLLFTQSFGSFLKTPWHNLFDWQCKSKKGGWFKNGQWTNWVCSDSNFFGLNFCRRDFCIPTSILVFIHFQTSTRWLYIWIDNQSSFLSNQSHLTCQRSNVHFRIVFHGELF